MVLNILIILGGVLLIIFNLWYKSRLRSFTRRLSDAPDEVEVKDEDVSKLKRMLYVNAGIAVITIALTIVKLIDVLK